MMMSDERVAQGFHDVNVTLLYLFTEVSSIHGTYVVMAHATAFHMVNSYRAVQLMLNGYGMPWNVVQREIM